MRLGRIGYVNCYPVYAAMDRGVVAAPATLVTGTPAELNDRLADGRLDVSVVSSLSYARHAASLELLSDLAVSSDGPVRSVLCLSRRPVRELEGARVLVSAASRSSVLLLRLLAEHRWGVRFEPRPVEAEPADLGRLATVPHDAVLVIGDAALLLSTSAGYPYVTDLGAEWKAWTGLPFVFAVWAARRDADRAAVRRVHRALLGSRRWGLSHLDDLAEAAARATGVDAGRCRAYLDGLDYALTSRHLEGLSEFLRRAVAAGAIAEPPITFVGAA